MESCCLQSGLLKDSNCWTRLDLQRDEVFSRALAFDLENEAAVDSVRSASENAWAARGLEASDLLSTWCQAA